MVVKQVKFTDVMLSTDVPKERWVKNNLWLKTKAYLSFWIILDILETMCNTWLWQLFNECWIKWICLSLKHWSVLQSYCSVTWTCPIILWLETDMLLYKPNIVKKLSMLQYMYRNCKTLHFAGFPSLALPCSS